MIDAFLIGWEWNGDFYCLACAPTNDEDEAMPIYNDTDLAGFCCICGEEIHAKTEEA